MTIASPPADLRAAAVRFRAFFDELRHTFVEREDVLAQVALALLGREHVLMTGPPGTAKSGIAAAVLGRIVDERTGQPSLFARQFTESTVQTDLVGPIDFKTLMQTGRTEHFTDEGMLGAVHAFLDEVLDGRDMLLRTTLNVLHERELKQGGKTTRGAIECALMTTNRYLAEVLEGSRETLLAFVDRIAYVGFVPKGFAHPESLGRVLRTQVGGTRRRELVTTLTIQDLDVLQAAADRIVVPDEMLSALSSLLANLEADLAHAAKSDPTFLPTRYLSTRTAVRLARTLRAICVYDAVMRDDERALVVRHDDLALLRLSLLLSGPPREALGALLDKETDPRERRQLSILRTERDIFERALSRIPRVEPKPEARRAAPEIASLEKEVRAASGDADPRSLALAATKLAQTANAGGPAAPAAAELLERTLEGLAERALRAGATAGVGPGDADAVAELSSLADGLERASGTTRPVARWLRGRAVRTLLVTARLAAPRLGEAILPEGDRQTATTLEDFAKRAEAVAGRIEGLLEAAARLRAAGADEDGPESFDHATAEAAARLEDELWDVWDAGFRSAVGRALATVGPDELGRLLGALAPALAAINGFGARLARYGRDPASLENRVVGPRIEPLVEAAFARVEARDRLELVAQIGELVAHLENAKLGAVIPKATLLRMAAEALVRTEAARGAPPKAAPDLAGYRDLRAKEARVSLAYAIVELALRVSPKKPSATGSPEEMLRGLADVIGALPKELRAQMIALDVDRIDRALGLLEAWWKRLASELPSGKAPVGKALEALGSSRFFHVTSDEGALLRFELEARVVAEVFPEAKPRAAEITARAAELGASSGAALQELRRGRSDASWVELLDTTRRPTKP